MTSADLRILLPSLVAAGSLATALFAGCMGINPVPPIDGGANMGADGCVTEAGATCCYDDAGNALACCSDDAGNTFACCLDDAGNPCGSGPPILQDGSGD